MVPFRTGADTIFTINKAGLSLVGLRVRIRFWDALFLYIFERTTGGYFSLLLIHTSETLATGCVLNPVTTYETHPGADSSPLDITPGEGHFSHPAARQPALA